MNGGKELGEGVDWGAVLGGCGRWRSMKRVEVGVRKVEMWEEANWSTRLRYLMFIDRGQPMYVMVREKAWYI